MDQTQILAFCKAVVFAQEEGRGSTNFDDFEVACEGELIVGRITETANTIENFIEAQGEYSIEDTPFGQLYRWSCNKHYGRPGDLYVMDLGNFRAAHIE